MNNPNPLTMTAYGQIWHFSYDSLAALKQFGMGAPATLTNLILQLSPTDGFRDGDYYEVDYEGVRLSLRVAGKQVSLNVLSGPDEKPLPNPLSA